jgi:hypothetical protein
VDERSVAALREAKIASQRHCVWPGCGVESLVHVGPLCWTHANIITDAVIEASHSKVTNAHANAAMQRQREAEDRKKLAEIRGQQPGWIYYVRVGDRVKIGYSVDVKNRMRAYPPESRLLAVHPGTRQLETEMHRRFAGSRAAGREWFRETPDLVEHITEAVAQFGEPTKHRYNFRTDTTPLRRSRSA